MIRKSNRAASGVASITTSEAPHGATKTNGHLPGIVERIEKLEQDRQGVTAVVGEVDERPVALLLDASLGQARRKRWIQAAGEAGADAGVDALGLAEVAVDAHEVAAVVAFLRRHERRRQRPGVLAVAEAGDAPAGARHA